MAQIEQGEGKGKRHQKKMTIHVDFTPMVDMNMLLITFFMLCTTMIKSQTLQISLPSNEKVDQAEQTKVKQSEAITIILDSERDPNTPDGKKGAVTKDLVYYYEG
ncbi:MAG: biopolymer transporter ExbD, partial [Muribaculaceae bacterium]